MNARTFLLSTLLSLLLQSCVSVKQSQTLAQKPPADCLLSAGFLPIRLIRSTDHLVMRVNINGHRAKMVLATNNPFSQMDRKFLRKVHIEEQKTDVPVRDTFGGSQPAGTATLKTLAVSDVVFHEVPVAIVNLNRRFWMPQYNGVFALSELRQMGGIIDCADRTLYLRPKGPHRKGSQRLRVRLARAGFTRVPLRLNSEEDLLVDCVINGHRSVMYVSIEAYVTHIGQQTAAEADVRPSAAELRTYALGRRRGLMQLAPAKDLSIGEFKIRNAPLFVSASKLNALGIDALEAKHAIIDTGALALYLKH